MTQTIWITTIVEPIVGFAAVLSLVLQSASVPLLMLLLLVDPVMLLLLLLLLLIENSEHENYDKLIMPAAIDRRC